MPEFCRRVQCSLAAAHSHPIMYRAGEQETQPAVIKRQRQQCVLMMMHTEFVNYTPFALVCKQASVYLSVCLSACRRSCDASTLAQLLYKNVMHTTKRYSSVRTIPLHSSMSVSSACGLQPRKRQMRQKRRALKRQSKQTLICRIDVAATSTAIMQAVAQQQNNRVRNNAAEVGQPFNGGAIIRVYLVGNTMADNAYVHRFMYILLGNIGRRNVIACRRPGGVRRSMPRFKQAVLSVCQCISIHCTACWRRNFADRWRLCPRPVMLNNAEYGTLNRDATAMPLFVHISFHQVQIQQKCAFYSLFTCHSIDILYGNKSM